MTIDTLEIIYEDEYLIAVNKPAGLLVHPSWLTPKGTENVASMLKNYLKGTVHTVHRLDRATSGVLLCAKDRETAKIISEDFANHNLTKTYVCVVRGFAPEEGIIDHPLKYQPDKKAEPLMDENKPAQEAVTHFKRLATVELDIAVGKWPKSRYSLMQVTPQTGRKHQIRRHFKHILCPLIGDTNYGEGRHNRLFRENFNSHRLLLMATTLEIQHPVTAQTLLLRGEMSSQVVELFQQLGWHEFVV